MYTDFDLISVMIWKKHAQWTVMVCVGSGNAKYSGYEARSKWFSNSRICLEAPYLFIIVGVDAWFKGAEGPFLEWKIISFCNDWCFHISSIVEISLCTSLLIRGVPSSSISANVVQELWSVSNRECAIHAEVESWGRCSDSASQTAAWPIKRNNAKTQFVLGQFLSRALKGFPNRQELALLLHIAQQLHRKSTSIQQTIISADRLLIKSVPLLLNNRSGSCVHFILLTLLDLPLSLEEHFFHPRE